jgi:hypothetical protein
VTLDKATSVDLLDRDEVGSAAESPAEEQAVESPADTERRHTRPQAGTAAERAAARRARLREKGER